MLDARNRMTCGQCAPDATAHYTAIESDDAVDGDVKPPRPPKTPQMPPICRSDHESDTYYHERHKLAVCGVRRFGVSQTPDRCRHHEVVIEVVIAAKPTVVDDSRHHAKW